MIREAISLLVQNIHLSEAEMAECMLEIMEGAATDAQIAAFLTALRIKGETVEEITGAAKIMRAKAVHIQAPAGAVDIVGTGGDMAGTFNVSTTSALVVAAAGVPVAKHGNRSVSSKSGAADVLEALGVKINLPPAHIERCLAETGFGFLFAPLFHPAMKFAVDPRRDIAIRTVFNILGPLTNPAGTRRQVVGVFAEKLTEPIAQVLVNLGIERAMVVHGADGLDEITVCDVTRISQAEHGIVETLYISPEGYGFARAERDAILGAGKDVNAAITLSILRGEKGPKRDMVLLNAAAALIVAGVAADFTTGIARAAEAVDSGKAMRKLEQIKAFTNAGGALLAD